MVGSEHEVLSQSPYRAQWIEEAPGNASNQVTIFNLVPYFDYQCQGHGQS